MARIVNLRLQKVWANRDPILQTLGRPVFIHQNYDAARGNVIIIINTSLVTWWWIYKGVSVHFTSLISPQDGGNAPHTNQACVCWTSAPSHPPRWPFWPYVNGETVRNCPQCPAEGKALSPRQLSQLGEMLWLWNRYYWASSGQTLPANNPHFQISPNKLREEDEPSVDTDASERSFWRELKNSPPHRLEAVTRGLHNRPGLLISSAV